jgi:hypothetical protein
MLLVVSFNDAQQRYIILWACNADGFQLVVFAIPRYGGIALRSRLVHFSRAL